MQEVLSDSGKRQRLLIYLTDYIKCTFPLVSVFPFRVESLYSSLASLSRLCRYVGEQQILARVRLAPCDCYLDCKVLGAGYDLANQTPYLDAMLRWGLDWLIKVSQLSLFLEVPNSHIRRRIQQIILFSFRSLMVSYLSPPVFHCLLIELSS